MSDRDDRASLYVLGGEARPLQHAVNVAQLGERNRAFRIAVRHCRKCRRDVACRPYSFAGVKRNNLFRASDLVLWPRAEDFGSATIWAHLP